MHLTTSTTNQWVITSNQNEQCHAFPSPNCILYSLNPYGVPMCPYFAVFKQNLLDTICPRSSDPFYIVTYYIKQVTASLDRRYYTKEENSFANEQYWGTIQGF